LITRFMTPDGVGEVTDFMPVAGDRPTERHRLVRRLRVVRGAMRFVAEIKPRFDYGRKPHKLGPTDTGAVFRAHRMERTVNTAGRRGASVEELGEDAQRVGEDLRIVRTLREGETAGIELEWMGGNPRRIPAGELDRLSHDTQQFWRNWLARSTYAGRWRETV